MTGYATQVKEAKRRTERRLSDQAADPAAHVAREIARLGYSGAVELAKREGNERQRFVVSGAADDSFCDVQGAVQRLRNEGWNEAMPPKVCEETGVKVIVFRKGV